MHVSKRANVRRGCRALFQRDAVRRVRAAFAIPRHPAIVEPVHETRRRWSKGIPLSRVELNFPDDVRHLWEPARRNRARRNQTGNLRIILRGSGLGGNQSNWPTTQAQRPGPREAWIATRARWPGSLLVRRHLLLSGHGLHKSTSARSSRRARIHTCDKTLWRDRRRRACADESHHNAP